MICNVVWCEHYTGEDCGRTWCPAHLISNTKDVNTIITNNTKNDLVAVVRCKDCKHSKYREDYDDYECEASGCGLVNNADFYCADGERKEIK